MYELDDHTGGIEMTSNRQDAWNQDEDVLLAEVVLRHIREGGTQLQAFEEVGKKLSRTAAACGFRWNSFVRKQYKSGIELAKKQRKESKKDHSLKKEKTSNSNENNHSEKNSFEFSVDTIEAHHDQFSMSGMIQYLQKAEEALRNEEELLASVEEYKTQVVQLKDEVKQLQKKNFEYESKLRLLEDDHQSLLTIFEKARKMALLQESEDKVKFQMDRNGNLQRLNK